MKSLIGILLLAACTVGCGHNSGPAGGTATNTFEDQDGIHSSDALVAPLQPELTIRSAPETLIFEWQPQHAAQLANLYSYDVATREESLIASDLAATQTTFSIPSQTAARAWHAEQFRLELCDATACVSSNRMNIGSLAADSMRTLRPSVFLRGEQFADSVASNDDASVVAVTRPAEGALQIYLYHQTQWVDTQSVPIASPVQATIIDVASSGNSDTLAVLVATKTPMNTPSSVYLLERLGEAWLVVDQLTLPEKFDINRHSSISLSADGDHLLVHAGANTLSLERIAQQWRAYAALVNIADAGYLALSASRQFNYLLGLSRHNQQIWLVIHRRIKLENAFVWQEFHRLPLQGIDVDSEVRLKSHADGSAVIVVGWERTQTAQRTPVVWRFDINHSPQVDDSFSTVNLRDSLRAPPAFDQRARLRFDADDTLEHIAVGWQLQADDDARLSMYHFVATERQWRATLELPADVSTLAKQGFAHAANLSADGQTLLVSVLSGNASGSQNRAGELLIAR